MYVDLKNTDNLILEKTKSRVDLGTKHDAKITFKKFEN